MPPHPRCRLLGAAPPPRCRLLFSSVPPPRCCLGFSVRPPRCCLNSLSVLGFWCGCRFLGRSGLVWAGQGRSGLVWAGPAGRPAGFGEKTLSRRPAGFGQKTKEEEESKCRNVKSVPRPAGRPAGFGENIRETCWSAKNGKKLAGRPAGFGQNRKEEEEPKVKQNKGVVLGVCSKTRFLTKIDNCKNYIGKSIDTIYTKPRLICQWHLKLFCIRKSFMRDLIV